MYTGVSRIFDVPRHQQKNYPQQVALANKINGKWLTISIDDYIAKANLASKGLLKLGIQPGDKVAMISNNRWEWNVMDIAILQAGAITVPIYPTISEKDYAYILNDGQVKMVIVSEEELLQKVECIKDQVPSLTSIYSFNQLRGVKHWESILEEGKDGNQDQLDAIMASIKDTDLATLIYTSGTTGLPKGVMLSHRNLISNAVSCTTRFPVVAGTKALSFLPVCHVYERMLLYLYQLKGVEIYFAESMETIVSDMQDVKPHVFTAVPRLLEKVYDKIVAKGQDLTGIKRSLFFWALELGHNYEAYGKNGAWYEFKLKIARKLIFVKWQEALGGNVMLIASGSAALQPRLARVFHAAGIKVMEGYGLTETSPVIAVNELANKGLMFGTVGRTIDGVEVKIAEDGEILTKGPNLMMGYYNMPDKTAEAIDTDGWFHTGDIGELVNGEYLKITDRKKEIFKTSGGKYIAPQVLENAYKESRFIEQIVVVGEFKKHPAALVVPSFDFVKEWANQKGLSFSSNEELCKNEKVINRIMEDIKRINENFGNWEQVKKIVLLSKEMSVDSGELTPTLKLKRKIINENYASEIEAIYGE